MHAGSTVLLMWGKGLHGGFLMLPERSLSDASSPPAEPPRASLAERLFTAENVRILQSLGIVIIFISAAAFVRNQMWETSTNWGCLLMLVGGSIGTYALGALLRRLT